MRLLVGDKVFLGEPQVDLLLGILNGVRSVADVTSNILDEEI